MAFRMHASVVWLVVIAILTGCASSEVTHHQPTQGRTPPPDRIIVYDVAVAPSESPADVAIAGQGAAPPPPTAEPRAAGRRLGAEIAKNVVSELQTMGLPAVRSAGQPSPRPGDGLVVGYFATIEKGSTAERVGIGFGAGGAELVTVVKGCLVTATGLQPIGSGTVEAGSGKTPGGAVPLVVAVATGNPVGLLVSGAAKVYGEASGSETIEGAARRTAEEIAEKIRATAEKQGWI